MLLNIVFIIMCVSVLIIMVCNSTHSNYLSLPSDMVCVFMLVICFLIGSRDLASCGIGAMLVLHLFKLFGSKKQ